MQGFPGRGAAVRSAESPPRRARGARALLCAGGGGGVASERGSLRGEGGAAGRGPDAGTTAPWRERTPTRGPAGPLSARHSRPDSPPPPSGGGRNSSERRTGRRLGLCGAAGGRVEPGRAPRAGLPGDWRPEKTREPPAQRGAEPRPLQNAIAALTGLAPWTERRPAD